jgi:6-phosphogluconolactonase
MSVTINQFDDRETMLESLYERIIGDLEQALALQSSITLLLSGGSTPGPLYQRLATAELNWKRVNVALVDERWVEPEHEASNERLLREKLLTGNAAEAKLVGMKNARATPFDGATECSASYATLPAPYSLCLLGMGPDGHTASLFPGAEGLEAALASKQHCAPIRARRSEVTGDYVERMTMTPWGILQSRRLILLFTGAEKWDVYEAACRSSASTDELPISWFIHQDKVPLEVYWAP